MQFTRLTLNIIIYCMRNREREKMREDSKKKSVYSISHAEVILAIPFD